MPGDLSARSPLCLETYLPGALSSWSLSVRRLSCLKTSNPEGFAGRMSPADLPGVVSEIGLTRIQAYPGSMPHRRSHRTGRIRISGIGQRCDGPEGRTGRGWFRLNPGQGALEQPRSRREGAEQPRGSSAGSGVGKPPESSRQGGELPEHSSEAAGRWSSAPSEIQAYFYRCGPMRTEADRG